MQWLIDPQLIVNRIVKFSQGSYIGVKKPASEAAGVVRNTQVHMPE